MTKHLEQALKEQESREIRYEPYKPDWLEKTQVVLTTLTLFVLFYLILFGSDQAQDNGDGITDIKTAICLDSDSREVRQLLC